MMEKIDTLVLALASFLLGVVVTLSIVVIVQILFADFSSFPTQQIRAALNII